MSRAITYEIEDELQGPVRALVDEHHPHLADAKIAVLYRIGKWICRGKKEKGKALIVPAIWQCMTGLDLLLVVNKKAYLRQDEAGRLAMLDELLCRYADTDAARYVTREPDIQEFSDIVNRRKVCFSDLSLIMTGGDIHKIDLGDDDDDDGADDEIEALDLDDTDHPLDVWIEDYDDIDRSQEQVLKVMNFDT